MKNLSKLLIGFFIIFVSGFTEAQYAPWAKLSSDAPKEINARKYPVPSKTEVGIPAYPGAFISSVSAPRQDTIEYKKEVLPFVILVSTDTPSKVISFYKKILTKDKGWTYSEEFTTFVKGEIANALTGFVPAVAIRDENGNNFDLVNIDEGLRNRLKSRIQITYKPAGEKK